MKRRRFLQLSAAFACAPRLAEATTWRGYALGADVSLTLHGPHEVTAPVLSDLPDWLEAFEQEFSLYRPNSALVQLNETGFHAGSDRFHALMTHVQDAFTLTEGLFDPTIQPLWRALATGADLAKAQDLIGWTDVRHSARDIQLGPGQQLTLNGIAQGYATDLLRAELGQRGFTKALINLGEHSALGGPFHLGLTDPHHGHLGQRSLTDRAIATSSPAALDLGGRGHILAPDGRAPLWTTVSIEADSATRADALSTAAVFMTHAQLKSLKITAQLHRITLVDAEGNLTTL